MAAVYIHQDPAVFPHTTVIKFRIDIDMNPSSPGKVQYLQYHILGESPGILYL